MGYTIMIGEAAIEPCDVDDYEGQLIARYRVKLERHDAAPASGDPTDFENQRWPSYTGWHDFAVAVRLHDLLFDKDRGLMREHPGCFQLTTEHLTEVQAALHTYSQHDYNMARLIWLEYWIRWALENCDSPAMENS
jgi:hypothetical protein